MTNIVGTFELQNDTGEYVTDPSAKAEVSGSPKGTISLVSLADGTKSLSTQFNVKEGATIDWVVAFTDKSGTTKNGTVTCNCAPDSKSATALVTLKVNSFTVAITGAGTCTGSYT